MTGTFQGLLIGIIDANVQDEELEKHAIEFQTPVVFKDEYFGEFILDRELNWLVAEVVWQSKPIWLALSMDNCESRHVLIALAISLWESQNSLSSRITDLTVTELLPVKNDSWLEDGEEVLTPKEFGEKMELESITLYADGRFEFWHNDGDLFWGHSILVNGNMDNGPLSSEIAG